MPGIIAPIEQDLDWRIIAMGTCRVLRIKQVGAVYFVENDVGHINEKGVREEAWKVCAVSKGPEALKESLQFLSRANVDVLNMMAKDLNTRRATPA